MKKKFLSLAMLGMALMGMGVLTSSCNKNKYKSMTEISASEDSAEAEGGTDIRPLDTNVASAVDDALMKKYNAAFFENEANKGATASAEKWAQTASGLRYVIVKPGEGTSPGPTSEVTVHYTGMLTNGTVFDSSVSRGEPTSFPLNRVIPGWTEGLQLMKPGGVAVFFIPGDLAYGEQGQPGAGIEPNATLIFGVELLSVNS